MQQDATNTGFIIIYKYKSTGKTCEQTITCLDIQQRWNNVSLCEKHLVDQVNVEDANLMSPAACICWHSMVSFLSDHLAKLLWHNRVYNYISYLNDVIICVFWKH